MFQAEDIRAIQKHDQVLVIDFLSRCTEVLLKHELIPDKLCSEFRLSLRDPVLLGTSHTNEASSLLIRLTTQQSELLIGLIGRFGEAALFTNLLRFSLRSPLIQMQKVLQNMGQELLKKSELLFNRTLYWYRHQKCEAQILAPSILLEVAEEISSTILTISSAQQSLNHLAASKQHYKQPIDDQVDQDLAQALNFASVQLTSLAFRLENQAAAQIRHALTQLSVTISQVLEQLRRNEKNLTILPALSRLDRLSAEIHRLEALPMNPDDDLSLWESRRLLWLESFDKLHLLLDSLGRELNRLFKSSSFHAGEEFQELPTSMLNCLVSEMIAAGHNPKDALAAGKALIDYCTQQHLRPSRLLSAELKKIHPLLTEQSLQLLQEMDIDRSLATQSGQEKKWILDRSSRLMDTFKTVLGVILACGLVLPACGLKTAPTSQIDDLRPEVPYQSTAKPGRRKKEQKQSSEQDTPSRHNSSPTTNEAMESP